MICGGVWAAGVVAAEGAPPVGSAEMVPLPPEGNTLALRLSFEQPAVAEMVAVAISHALKTRVFLVVSCMSCLGLGGGGVGSGDLEEVVYLAIGRLQIT